MNFLFLLKNPYIRHTLIWIALTIYIFIIDSFEGTWLGNVVGTILLMLNYAFIYYYISLFALERFWGKNYYKVFVSLIIGLIAFVSLDILALFKIMPFFGGINPYSLEKIIKHDFIIYHIVTIASATYFSNRQVVKKIKIQNEKEKSLLVRELTFLKSQFNSHITMNFLNFCYSNVIETLPKTADAIELFSNILRYTLTTSVDEKILLEKEVEYLKNYLLLQKLLTAEVYVDFKITGNISATQVIPRLLISLVENAFKHGVFNKRLTPVIIILNCCNGIIEFSVENKKSTKSSKMMSGIGYSNMNQVLDFYYKDKYKFSVNDNNEIYSCTLKIINE